MAEGGPRCPKEPHRYPMIAKRTVRDSQWEPKGAEREPKAPKPPTRGPTSARDSEVDSKGTPKGAKGFPRSPQRKPKAPKRHPREASGASYICKLPINRPSGRYVITYYKLIYLHICI